MLDWQPTVPLATGLKETIGYFKKKLSIAGSVSLRVRLWPVILAILARRVVVGLPGKTEPPPAAWPVAEVKDGDTLVLTDGRKVRYLGIDTPELSSTDPRELEFARLAKEVNAELVQGANCAWNTTWSATISITGCWPMSFSRTAGW